MVGYDKYSPNYRLINPQSRKHLEWSDASNICNEEEVLQPDNQQEEFEDAREHLKPDAQENEEVYHLRNR